MIKKFILVFLILILCAELYSTENNPFIKEILIYGNTKTKESIIRRALDLKKGQKFDPERIKKSKENLIDLNIFTHVDIEIKKSKDGIILLVILNERPPFFFEPIVDYSDETHKNSWGVKVGYCNLSGMNQDVWLAGTLGNLKKLEVGYQNNYFLDFFWGMSLGNSWYKNEYYGFKEDRFTGKIFAGKKISRFKTYLWANYEKIKIKESPKPHLENPEELYKLGIDISYNSKDWEVFPLKGVVAQISFYKSLSGKMKSVYDRYKFKISSFFNLGKRNVLAFDFKSTISGGTVPIYEKIFFGGINTLRAIPVGTYSGNNYIVFTSEYRIPITLRKKPWDKNPTGLAIHLFSDFGSITERTRDFRIKDFKSNLGLGLLWVYMEGIQLRIDVGMSPRFRLLLSTRMKF